MFKLAPSSRGWDSLWSLDNATLLKSGSPLNRDAPGKAFSVKKILKRSIDHWYIIIFVLLGN
jgi:hypothetical protein